MENLKSAVILFLLSFYSFNSFSQNNIQGKITGNEQQPLSGVSIIISELQRVTVSDADGNYKIRNIPSGKFIINYSLLGYKSVNRIIIPTDSVNTYVELEAGITELNEVLISANNNYAPENFPFPANGFLKNDLKEFNAPTVMANLSYLAGVDKITIGNGISKPVIRGLSFNQIMLYSQGTRIENQQWDDHHDLGLFDIGIEKVEIIKGPAALIYGADAIGGALVFIDENPAASGTKSGDVNLGFFSNTLGINADAGVKGANSNGLFYGLRIGGSSHTSYVQGEGEEKDNAPGEEEKEFAANSKFMNAQGKFNIGVSRNWGISKLSYSYLNQQIGIIEDESAGGTGAGEDEEEQRDRGMEAPYQGVITQIISSENTFFLSKSKLNVNVAYQINDRSEYEPVGNKQKELSIGLKLSVATYDVKWTSDATKAFGVTVGSQGTFLQNRNNGKESLVPDADVKDLAGFGLIRYDHQKLNLLGGIRVDARNIESESYEKNEIEEEAQFIILNSNDTIPKPEHDFEKKYTPVSFSLGGTYLFNSHLSMKLNAATGFTAPNYAQLGTFGKHEGTYRFEKGNEQLNVEQNLEGDLGLSWKNNSVTFNISGYVNTIRDYIYIANTGDSITMITPDARDSFPLYEYRQGDVTYSGGEFEIRFHPEKAEWINLNLSYSIIDASLKSGGKVPYVPSNKLVAEIRVGRKQLWKFNQPCVNLRVSNYEKRNEVAAYELSTGGYTLLDFSVGGNFIFSKQNVRLSLFCTNILNTGYYNQLSLVKYIGVKEMGRNIGFNLHIPFGI